MENLFKIIQTTIEQIDEDLKISNGTGIYFSPELYVAFCLGREISKNRKEIFRQDKVEWLREIDLGNGGPSDIVFKSEEHLTVFELKLRGTYDSYKADIEKLKRLKDGIRKYFCVLLDSFTQQNDDRLIKIEKEYLTAIKNVGHFAFPTWNNWYQRQIYCNLNLYEIF